MFVPGRGATLDRLEHLGRVLALRHTPAAPEGGEQLRRLTDTRHDHLEEAADEERRVRIREHRRVLGWEDVVPALGTVEDVAGRGHGVQPLAEIAGAEARPGGERLDRHGSRVGERPEELETIADEAERPQERRADVRDDLSQERLCLRPVEPCVHAVPLAGSPPLGAARWRAKCPHSITQGQPSTQGTERCQGSTFSPTNFPFRSG